MDPASIIRRSSRCFGKNVAVSFEGRLQTYAEMFERARRLANALRDAGARPHEPVAVLGENAFETIEQAAACALGNFPRATLYAYHAPATNRYLLELTGARVLIVQTKYHAALEPLLAGLDRLAAVFVYGGDPGPSATSYEAAIGSARDDDVLVPVAGDDITIIRFSSGTTGRPKAVCHSVSRWVAYNSEWRWVTPMIDETSRYLTPTSLAHLGVALLWGILSVGGRIIPMATFDAGQTAELLEAERVSHTVMAPIMIRSVLDDPTIRSRDLSSLKCLMYAGSPIAPSTLRSAIEVFGHTLFQLYAQSEAMPITMLLPHQHRTEGTERELRRLRSVGRATPNFTVTIRGEDGAVLPLGEVGEVAATGPSTMSGFWNDPAATASRTLSDGALLTRDMGFMDEDGFLYLVDRKDDMIVSGGFNIWPTELENALLEHPAVAEACVFGVPDEKWGETPKAAVVLRPGKQVSETMLIDHVRSIVGGVKKVTSVAFLDMLPRSATGKVSRKDLKAPYWSDRATRISGS